MKTPQNRIAAELGIADLSNLDLEKATKLARERGMAARADLFREMFRQGVASVRTLLSTPGRHGSPSHCADCA